MHISTQTLLLLTHLLSTTSFTSAHAPAGPPKLLPRHTDDDPSATESECIDDSPLVTQAPAPAPTQSTVVVTITDYTTVWVDLSTAATAPKSSQRGQRSTVAVTITEYTTVHPTGTISKQKSSAPASSGKTGPSGSSSSPEKSKPTSTEPDNPNPEESPKMTKNPGTASRPLIPAFQLPTLTKRPGKSRSGQKDSDATTTTSEKGTASETMQASATQSALTTTTGSGFVPTTTTKQPGEETDGMMSILPISTPGPATSSPGPSSSPADASTATSPSSTPHPYTPTPPPSKPSAKPSAPPPKEKEEENEREYCDETDSETEKRDIVATLAKKIIDQDLWSSITSCQGAENTASPGGKHRYCPDENGGIWAGDWDGVQRRGRTVTRKW